MDVAESIFTKCYLWWTFKERLDETQPARSSPPEASEEAPSARRAQQPWISAAACEINNAALSLLTHN